MNVMRELTALGVGGFTGYELWDFGLPWYSCLMLAMLLWEHIRLRHQHD